MGKGVTITDRITFLYTNIGRGHPFYLDGIVEALVRKGNIRLVHSQTGVFEQSRGLARSGWKAAAWLYRKGSSGGVIGRIYDQLRSRGDYNCPSMLLNLVGRDIRRKYIGDPQPMVVAHPTLVAVLRGKRNLIYQHGEVVTPSEAVVTGADVVLVPTEENAEPFHECGYAGNNVVVTGLCIEPALVRQAEDAFQLRIERIDSQQPLTGAFFSSGAEPKAHVDRLVTAAKRTALNGGRAIMFAKKGGSYMKDAIGRIAPSGLQYEIVDATDFIPAELPRVLIVGFHSRREENIFTARLFHSFDYFVAPSHERSNWALGLGLPMFIVGPCIGPFSPLNREKLLSSNVARTIDSLEQAEHFSRILADSRRSGELVSMARAGWGRLPITGFESIADRLINRYIAKLL